MTMIIRCCVPRLLALACLLLSVVSQADADVLFSSFGPGDTYDTLNGAEIVGPAATEPQALAEQFIPAASFYLDSVDLALSSPVSGPDLRVGVYSDAGGIPGSLLETTQANSFTNGIVSTSFAGDVLLTGGSSYWLGLFAEGANQLTWHDSLSPGFTSQAFSEDDGVTWLAFSSDPFPGAAYRINGTLAEPPEIPLIDAGQIWHYFPGLAEPSIGTAWTNTTFDDSSWDFDPEGFGYDDDLATQAGLLSNVATPMLGMRDNGTNADAHTVVYLRREFTVANPMELAELVLQLDYDDSFIAYINGIEVARSNFGTVGLAEPFDALGSDHESTNGEANQSLERFSIDLLDDFPGLLVAGGSNVLAIQGLNSALDDDDFVLSQITLGGNLFSVILPGDYNADGTVNAADYTVWRDNLGGAAGSLQNDIDGGIIGVAQYMTWKTQFGQTVSSGATAVPEPSSALIVIVSGAIIFLPRNRAKLSKRGDLVL